MTGDFDVTMSELREVARFALESAETLLPLFEAASNDDRPRLAIDAAQLFVSGDRRRKLQRVASLEAHRAATSSTTELTKLAATAAGDAASAAYLHPISKSHQVGHILRATACEIRAAQLGALGTPSAVLEKCIARATPTLRSVLSRYPLFTPGRSALSTTIADLDRRLRDPLAGSFDTE